ncbi:protein hairy-like [Portunus trituberculatus]|uniref:protein hairy-like n=1 Tax=Portunus trituberculatus TaxID=210409 RepID=UPI001E1CBE97|nr:protein hairy-like [Portunus trituberculatus]
MTTQEEEERRRRRGVCLRSVCRGGAGAEGRIGVTVAAKRDPHTATGLHQGRCCRVARCLTITTTISSTATCPPTNTATAATMGVQQQEQQGDLKPRKSTKPVSEARRIRKPLMERKRRERINTSLNDLASLLTEARMVRPDAGGRPAKLEKADILELTVKHIRTLKEKGSATDLPKETKEMVKKEDKMEEEEEKGEKVTEKKKTSAEGRYLAGFRRCMNLVEEKLQQTGKEVLKERLLDHLGLCLTNLESRLSAPDAFTAVKSEDSAATTVEDTGASGKENSTATPGTCLTLTPTRLSTGVLAFVVQGPLPPALLTQRSSSSRPHSPSSQIPDTLTPPNSTTTTTTSPSPSSSSQECQPYPCPHHPPSSPRPHPLMIYPHPLTTSHPTPTPPHTPTA